MCAREYLSIRPRNTDNKEENETHSQVRTATDMHVETETDSHVETDSQVEMESKVKPTVKSQDQQPTQKRNIENEAGVKLTVRPSAKLEAIQGEKTELQISNSEVKVGLYPNESSLQPS
jgi:phosphotransferase system IIB component